MASKLVVPLIILLSLFSSLSDINIITASSHGENYAKTINRSLLGLKKEKLTRFRVYWHDILSGHNPSSVMVVPPKANTSFGLINMIDNPLTSGMEMNSTLVGRAQGIYASASREQLGFLMAMNFVFTEGKYNGSTVTVMGRNAAMTEVREMPVVGGSGLFRFARGYVEARTKWWDPRSGDATVEYTCHVLHY